jgi:2-polyprenyl-3-methyl-5-hydroxy-6-metoxy-1,4-benzoquinol methylase
MNHSGVNRRMIELPENISIFTAMNSFVRHDLPLNANQREIFEAAGAELFAGLKKLDIQSLPISDYNKNYLKDYQKRLYYGIETGLFILAHALFKSSKSMAEITIIDHGGGTGLLSMLARKCGFATVIYNDIYEPSCKDAAVIAASMKASANHYVHGDIQQLSTFLKNQQITAHLIISRNVFEHIYDASSFLKTCALLPGDDLVLFFATTSNPHNPAVKLYTQKLQHQAEWKGFSSRWGKASDNIRALREVRKEIILSTGLSFSNKETEQLISLTRGLLKEEIVAGVQQYKTKGILPSPYDAASNTCDPYTGNWTERLTSVSTIEKWFQSAGFEYETINGFYDTHYQKGWKNLICRSLNSFIQPKGAAGLFFCPFIGLSGKKQQPR